MAKPPPRRALGIIGAMAEDSANELFGLSKDSPRIREIEVDRIEANPHQPRRHFDEDELAGLADSIARHGLLQPILVRQEGERYVLVAGERRLRARRLLGEALIPALVTTGDPAEIALVENLQRADLDPFELAAGLARLKERHDYSDEEIGKAIGKSQTETSRTLRLLALPSSIQDEWRAGYRHISRSVLYEICFAEDEDTQLALWEKAKAGGTVGAMRKARKASDRDPNAPAWRPTSMKPADIEMRLERWNTEMIELQRFAETRPVLTDLHRNRLRDIKATIELMLKRW